MPDFCAAYGCSNQRDLKTRILGITFHIFPKNAERRRQWQLALRRDGFVATDRTRLCSQHFRTEDFDRTGQTVRLRDGVIPTIFKFTTHIQKSVTTRSTKTSRRVKDLPMDLKDVHQPDGRTNGERRKSCKRQATDHLYALPACPKAVKAKLQMMSLRVRKLQQEKNNALRRENKAKKNMQAVLEELKDKNLISEELKDKLENFGCNYS